MVGARTEGVRSAGAISSDAQRARFPGALVLPEDEGDAFTDVEVPPATYILVRLINPRIEVGEMDEDVGTLRIIVGADKSEPLAGEPFEDDASAQWAALFVGGWKHHRRRGNSRPNVLAGRGRSVVEPRRKRS